jgi:hypothetical protein
LIGLALVLGLLFLFLNARTRSGWRRAFRWRWLAAIAMMYMGGPDHQHDVAVRADHHAGRGGG